MDLTELEAMPNDGNCGISHHRAAKGMDVYDSQHDELQHRGCTGGPIPGNKILSIVGNLRRAERRASSHMQKSDVI